MSSSTVASRRLGVFRAVAGNGGLRRVVGGYALFTLTEYAVWIAMLVYAYGRGGATIAGVVALAQLVPAALLAPVFAAAADRRSPVVLLAGGYLVQAAAMAATAVAITAVCRWRRTRRRWWLPRLSPRPARPSRRWFRRWRPPRTS